MKKIIVLLVIMLLYNCSEMNELHQPYLDRGEQIYTEKALGLTAFSGKNRVELKWVLLSDISIRKARIIWEDKFDVKDSLDIDITVTSGIVELYSKVIEGLEEGSYLFEVKTMDGFGNQSVPVTKIGKALGDIYLATLTNRQIASHVVDVDDIFAVEFEMSTNLPEDYIYSEFKYTNNNGEEATYTLPTDNLAGFSLDLSDIDITKNIFFRSVYLPFGNGIDLFYTDYEEYIID
ncbi:DUF4998 domain-containing protein [uncultured Algibacter sp.]|uniref:DUF4998 domain-containing protein n=1 Tax=uncultured Algibacter sp. TaxID=298659 RepID=UPI00261C7301|nr:DUF4998 domain-containing protein [uncultured Algibacter sp.]